MAGCFLLIGASKSPSFFFDSGDHFRLQTLAVVEEILNPMDECWRKASV